jgi:hypothetical protein
VLARGACTGQVSLMKKLMLVDPAQCLLAREVYILALQERMHGAGGHADEKTCVG